MNGKAATDIPTEAPKRQRIQTTTLRGSQTRTAWMLLIPTLLVVTLVALVPLIQTVWYSFTNARLASVPADAFCRAEELSIPASRHRVSRLDLGHR